MKEKTSISLSHDILAQIDRHVRGESRSSFIERVLRGYFRRLARASAHASDLERINRAADRLNAEAAQVLEFQAPWAGEPGGRSRRRRR